MNPAIALALLLLPVSSFAQNDEPRPLYSSGEQRVTLLELYTSEGCSSCPPADRWLGTLKSDTGLWRHFVPIALHVDYWNYIGWNDPYSQPAFSQRQRRHIELGSARAVYTPGFFSNGEEWLLWRRGSVPRAVPEWPGTLEISRDGDQLEASFRPRDAQPKRLNLTVALLGMQLETQVLAGENRGHTLTHDFVVLNLQHVRMQRQDTGFVARLAMPEARIPAPRLALVGWISAPGEQTPVQVTGGYLP